MCEKARWEYLVQRQCCGFTINSHELVMGMFPLPPILEWKMIDEKDKFRKKFVIINFMIIRRICKQKFKAFIFEKVSNLYLGLLNIHKKGKEFMSLWIPILPISSSFSLEKKQVKVKSGDNDLTENFIKIKLKLKNLQFSHQFQQLQLSFTHFQTHLPPLAQSNYSFSK